MINNIVGKIQILSNLLDSLSDDELIKVVSYLWFKDLYKTGIAFKRVWELIKCKQSHLLYSLYKLFWYKTIAWNSEINRENILKFNHQIIIKSESPNSFDNEITYLCSQFSRWPIDIDTSLLIKGLEDVTSLVPDHVSTCVSYTGKVLGQNRSFVANSHFPVPAIINEQDNPIWYNEIEDDIKHLVHSCFPFTKLVYDPNLKTTIPILSGIAYYEVKIHTDNKSFQRMDSNNVNNNTPNNVNITSDNNTTMNRNIPPCVAVGIAHPLHIDKLSSMPGWNDFSFAFHGDDGLFFHQQGHTGIQFTSDPEDAKFGSGDVVGFGIIHAPLTGKNFTELFLTINGKYVGKVNETDKYFHYFPWFPIVGTDSHSAIELNFGNKSVPFLFDLISFENEIIRTSSITSIKHNEPFHSDIYNKNDRKNIIKQSQLFRNPSYTNKYTQQCSDLISSDISTNIPSMFRAKYLYDYTQFLNNKLRRYSYVSAWHLTDDDEDFDDEDFDDDFNDEDELDNGFEDEDFDGEEDEEINEMEYDHELYQDGNIYDIYQDGDTEDLYSDSDDVHIDDMDNVIDDTNDIYQNDSLEDTNYSNQIYGINEDDEDNDYDNNNIDDVSENDSN